MALGSFGSAVTTGLTWATFSQVSSTAISATITGILYLFRSYYKSQDYRIISILSILRTRNYISIAELAGMLDVSEKRVIRDLRMMLSKGLLGKQAIIDMRIRYLILTEDAHDDAEQDAIKNGFVGGTFERRREDAAPSQSEAASSEDEFDKILKEIRQRDEEIQNEEVSAKIVKIEAITRNIFKFVEEKPEHKTQIRGFLNYYLPTTLKLLNSYAYFERQGIEGENIRAGKKNIEEILDMLIKGYEHQLDRLFEADTLSVESDISVLEQMLRRDGFYDDDFCIGKDNPFEVNNFSDKGYTDDISDSIGGGTAVAKQHEEEHKDE
jgi:DNA-binding Lrp family transcriptional regulator